MSASPPPPHWPVRPPHHRVVPAPRRAADDRPSDRPLQIRPTRPPLRTAVDVAARFGTAVTLAALLVVTAATLTAIDGAPAPAGVTTTQR